MTVESAPPPPPPASPPATTIGKYIARFRYEKPRPREARVAAQHSDFWWTESPRYSPSASPASTWASGDVFRFPEEEEESVSGECTEEEEKETIRQENTQERDVESVESQLRRRLEGENVTTSQSEDVLQSWGSMEWSSEAIEEELGVEEDPEEVIARVRKRLGWGATTSMDEGKRKERLLSPGSYRRGGLLDTFGDSSGEREQFDEVTSYMSSAEAKEEEEEEQRVTVAKCEEKMAGSGSSPGESDTQCRRSASSLSEFTAAEVHPSSSPEHSRHESEEYAEDEKGENEEKLQSPNKTQEQSAAGQLKELPLLPTASPARPEPVLEHVISSSKGSLSCRFHRSSSSSREQGEKIQTETAKTLDSLVSLVVHSWENDFFSNNPSEELDPAPIDNMCEDSPAKDQNLSGADDLWSSANTPTSPSLPAPIRGSDDQDSMHAKIVPSSELLADKSSLSSEVIAHSVEIEDEEEMEDCEVPGEEDDQIAQMLLGRIALLEASLRQVNN